MKHIEDTWPKKFKSEVKIMLLIIAMDGVNLYSLQNNNYFVCPVVLINNNIPSWFFMKNEHVVLDLIVPSKRQVKCMNSYLQQLIN